MLDSLKASFWPMNRVGSQEPEVGAPDAQSRLSELMDQLDAGIAKSTAREAAKPGGPGESAGAQQRETDPQPRDARAEVVLQVVRNVSLAPPSMEEPPSREDHVARDATSETLRLVADQRKAAEALLFEASVLEERLKDEAQASQAVRECGVAKEKADGAAVEAEEAMRAAVEKCNLRTAIEAQRKELEGLLVAQRAEAEAAQAKVEEFERALQEAKDFVMQKRSAVALHEVRAKECADKESAAQIEETQAVERMQASNVRRDAAQAEVAAAQERAEALKRTLIHNGPDGLEAVQSLAARISDQVKLIKQYRQGLSENTAA